jgi:hypothetical protein
MRSMELTTVQIYDQFCPTKQDEAAAKLHSDDRSGERELRVFRRSSGRFTGPERLSAKFTAPARVAVECHGQRNRRVVFKTAGSRDQRGRVAVTETVVRDRTWPAVFSAEPLKPP